MKVLNVCSSGHDIDFNSAFNKGTTGGREEEGMKKLLLLTSVFPIPGGE